MTLPKAASTTVSSNLPLSASGPDRRLILASASPRRLALLSQIGIVPADIRPISLDESPLTREPPRALAMRLAEAKAVQCHLEPDEIVLAADTVVAAGPRLLEKPSDADEAERFLKILSGRRHRVITGVTVRSTDRIRHRASETIVRFARLSPDEIANYVPAVNGKARQAVMPFRDWLRLSYPGSADPTAMLSGCHCAKP